MSGAGAAGANGGTFDPSPVTKIDVKRKTMFKLKSSIKNLINQNKKVLKKFAFEMKWLQ